MSRRRPSFTAVIGFSVYVLGGVAVVGSLLMVAALGDCVTNETGGGCEYDRYIKLVMFPGSLIIFLIVGAMLARFVMKEPD